MRRFQRRVARWLSAVTWLEAGLFLLATSLALFVTHSLVARVVWERDRTVELCVDGEEVRSLSDANDDRTYRSLNQLANLGVTSVAVYWDPSYPVGEILKEWDQRLPPGLRVALRPEAVPFSDWRHRWPRVARTRSITPEIAHVIFSGPSVLGYPSTAPVERWIVESSVTLPWPEFSRQRGLRALLEAMPHRVVRAHTLTEEEMAQAGVDRVDARYRRAVRERGVRFLYVRLFPGLSSEENFGFISRLAKELKADGFRLGPAQPRWMEFPRPLWALPPPLRQAIALLLAMAGPMLALAWASRRPGHWWDAFMRASLATLATALLIAAFLSAPEFVLGMEIFRGVKSSLLVPIVLAVFYLYRARELRHFLQEPLNVERLLFGTLFLGAALVYLLRSGHGTPVDATGGELQVRGILESVLGVRPRFKEFFIGHPLFLFGFYLRSRFTSAPFGDQPELRYQMANVVFHNWRPFVLAGFVGQLSIVNTFCHAHSPLYISALRTVHGLWLGALGGLALIGIFNLVYRHWET